MKWKTINELNKLQKLEELRFRANPLCSTEKEVTIRQMIISKIGNLEVVNRTRIERKKRIGDERKAAEIDYMKKFAKQWYELKDAIEAAKSDASKKEAEKNLETFYFEHPRYLEMVKSNGQLFLCLII